MIGILAEDPYDTNAIINLLSRSYNKKYKVLLRNLRGSQLDYNKSERLLIKEISANKISLVIYVRDLDGPKSDMKKLNKVNSWFNNLNKKVQPDGISLICIQELEGFILADIECFNKIYSSKIKFNGDPESITNPKEFLTSKTRKGKKKFREADNPHIFSLLDIEKINAKCSSFETFMEQFKEAI